MSRSCLNNIKPEIEKNTLIRHAHFTLLDLPISQSRLEQFRLETQNNQILQTLIFYTINGWPEKHQNTERVISLLLPPQRNYVP